MTETPGTSDSALADAVAAAIKKALDPEKIAKVAEAAADKAVTAAIDNALDYNSDFRKQLTTAIKSVLPLTTVGDLAAFTHAVRAVIRGRLENLANETAKTHIEDVMKRLLPDEPIIHIDALRKAFEGKLAQDIRMEDPCGCHDDDVELPDYTWIIQPSDSKSAMNYWYLYINGEEGVGKYGSNTITLSLHEIDGEPGLHQCYALNKVPKDHSLFMGPLYGFDSMLFRLGTGLSKLSTRKEPKAG